jgi:hypothetical protein
MRRGYGPCRDPVAFHGSWCGSTTPPGSGTDSASPSTGGFYFTLGDRQSDIWMSEVANLAR